MTASRLDRLSQRFSEGGAEQHLRRVDRRYWALYRTLGLSQSDVKETVKSHVDASQATVSRAIRKGNIRALTEPDFIELGGERDREEVKGEEWPEEWYDAYRDVLASAVTDRTALEIIASDQRLTPEWAARRFPELVGCNHYVANRFGTEVPDFATDNHLTHIDSVNPDRWR